MTPLYNKKFAVFFISTIAILGFGFNIYSNIDKQPELSKADHTESRYSDSKDTGSSSERNFKITGKEQTGASYLASTQNRQQRQDSNNDNDDSQQRTDAMAREEELAQQQKCHDSNIAEVGYVTEAYNQKSLNSSAANQQILYQMQSCSRTQIQQIISKIFADTEDKTHAMALLLDLIPLMPRALPIISAIRQQDFSNDDMTALIDMTKDQPTGIKQALVPSIVKNDSLDNFLALTQQDNFFSSYEQRNGSYPSGEQASQMIQGMILRERHNIQPEGAIYNHLLNTYPNSDTQNALTKMAFTPNQ
ncbi:MAG: hypothetical protein OEY36_11450 [Gammaproteobacteria bacterium]|nr:hypothetical protein [Gammaproteobacteria bacterium]